MMATQKKEKCSPSLEDGVIQSLYYLYQELLKENLQDLAYIMEATIRDFEEATRKHSSISHVGEETLRQFHILRGFRRLSKEQKELFIREIERAQTEH